MQTELLSTFVSVQTV